MKFNYEEAYKIRLPFRMPVIIRIDGKSFHTYTRKIKLTQPFDSNFWDLIHETGRYVAKNISGAVAVYSQSDEISILVHTYRKLDTNPYAGNELQKIVSHTSSMATAFFNWQMSSLTDQLAIFDSRAFVIPEAEVNNYFIWRQKDCIRNSISSLAQHHFSHQQLQNKNTKDMIAMLFEKGINIEDIKPMHYFGMLSTYLRGDWFNHYREKGQAGACNFAENPNVIEKLLGTEE